MYKTPKNFYQTKYDFLPNIARIIPTQTGHFAALLLPALAPYILAGPELFPFINQVICFQMKFLKQQSKVSKMQRLTGEGPIAPSFANPNYDEEQGKKEEKEEEQKIEDQEVLDTTPASGSEPLLIANV